MRRRKRERERGTAKGALKRGERGGKYTKEDTIVKSHCQPARYANAKYTEGLNAG